MNDAAHLTPCRRCQQQVSPQAPSCPKCGEPSPGFTPTVGDVAGDLLSTFVAMFVFGMGLGVLYLIFF